MSNRLIQETSLYLRQHADNPVHWWSWGEAAFAEAARRDCPVLLSIGYASCHWCHVMAHESFEDDVVAAQMNSCFVNIKVDREERPDVDKVYQTAHQLFHKQGGGWPLTVFLDPQTRTPFFTGTYFPKTSRLQMPAFSEVMDWVLETWQQQKSNVQSQGEQLRGALQAIHAPVAAAKLPDVEKMLALSCERLLRAADTQFGGFGQAPKFPMTTNLRLLFECVYFKQPELPGASHLLIHSLTCMARGGIFDQVGGGFFRYSTDQQWAIPHFEKMLYDNGLLLSLYASMLAHHKDNLFRDTVQRTARWLMLEMQSESGAYSASIDADSEGGEGAFYVWHKQAVKSLLDEQEYNLVETLFGLDKAANFEGQWHLRRTDAWHAVVRRLGLQADKAERLLQQALAKLQQERQSRPAPVRDDKVICAWNGLAIKGMAQASWYLDEPAYMDSAHRALDFIRTHLWRDGRLCSLWDQGQVKPLGFLDDYACLLDALLTLLGCRWRAQDARFALDLADAAIAHFFDSDAGGFFFTAHDHEVLISREKPMGDDTVPSGNALLADSLLKLGHLFAEPAYLEAAEATLRSVSSAWSEYPEMYSSLVCSLHTFNRHKSIVIVLGPADQLPAWLAVCRQYPATASYAIPCQPENANCLPPHLLASFEKAQNQVQAFVCHETSCQLPVFKLSDFAALMAQS